MRQFTVIAAVVVAAAIVPAWADWNPGDDHKMHFPQLPDHDGWDVAWQELNGEPLTLADDWTCSQSGPVNDVHFWFSSEGDEFDGDISWFRNGIVALSIWSNDPGDAQNYSRPKQQQWQWDTGLSEGDMTIRLYDTGNQGWTWPDEPGAAVPDDHQQIWQMNITNLPDPFWQNKGDVYWLSIHLNPAGPQGEMGPAIGWKTADTDRYPEPYTGNHYLDDAVWAEGDVPPDEWFELRDPLTDESLDLAFVITPEPATMTLLALGGLALLRRR